MIERVVIHAGSYHDSARLMRLARELNDLEDVDEAVVLMGTGMNRKLLAEAGFSDPVIESASPMDLVVALRAGTEQAADAAEAQLERLLRAATRGISAGDDRAPAASLEQAVEEHPEANLVSVAVPGAYAAYVARRALELGKHVFLFSDNVPVEDEIALKQSADERGLVVMGPDCGTSILGGVGLGFANRVRRGAIGLVGASGTGIQEISCLVHAMGGGVSHAIGTGSRDLAARVGGIMTARGIRQLADDPDTAVIVLVAKHPDQDVAARTEQVAAGCGKPVVIRYLGEPPAAGTGSVHYAASLDEAARRAVDAAAGNAAPWQMPPATVTQAKAGEAGHPDPFSGVADDARSLAGTGRLVGLFGGGSLAAEAAQVLRQAGHEVDTPDHPLRTEPGVEGEGHLVIDTGDDFYTVGKPHPMVDQAVRCGLIRKAGRDPAVGILLLDVVLGDGAHPDPAPELAAAVDAARAERGDKPLVVIASVCGTDRDPQDLERQKRLLSAAGIHVQPSSGRAARVAALCATAGTTAPSGAPGGMA